MADDLFDVRNALALGSYHQALAEGSHARCSSKKPEEAQAFNVERDALVAMAQVGLGQHAVAIGELRAATHPLLLAVRAWAEFHRALQSAAGAASLDATQGPLDALLQLAGEKPSGAGPAAAAAVFAGAAHLHRGEPAAAYVLSESWANALAAAGAGGSATSAVTAAGRQQLELRAIAIDALLRLNRPDLAERALGQMEKVDDESVLTRLAAASVRLRLVPTKGDAAAREVRSACQDMAAMYGQTAALLNLTAVANMMTPGGTAEAERALVDARGSKRAGDADTLCNLASVAAQQQKPVEYARFSAEAVAGNPDAPWAKQLAVMQQRFRDAAIAVAGRA